MDELVEQVCEFGFRIRLCLGLVGSHIQLSVCCLRRNSPKFGEFGRGASWRRKALGGEARCKSWDRRATEEQPYPSGSRRSSACSASRHSRQVYTRIPSTSSMKDSASGRSGPTQP
jgi:hypothetical protein